MESRVATHEEVSEAKRRLEDEEWHQEPLLRTSQQKPDLQG